MIGFVTNRSLPLRDASPFGWYYDLREAWEQPCESVIVAVDRYGLHPVRLLLPHQLYQKTADGLMIEHQAEAIWVLPVRDNWVRVCKRQ